MQFPESWLRSFCNPDLTTQQPIAIGPTELAQFTAYNTLAYGDVPRARMSAATSLYTAGQQLAAHLEQRLRGLGRDGQGAAPCHDPEVGGPQL